MATDPPPALLVYGATGYTGRLIAEKAARAGLDVAVAGRHRARVEALAERLSVPGRTCALDDPATVRGELQGVRCLLNVAVPFSRTAEQLIDACIAEGVHTPRHDRGVRALRTGRGAVRGRRGGRSDARAGRRPGTSCRATRSRCTPRAGCRDRSDSAWPSR
ncbi:saccharopine dehydrogenase NADP-binding domain-containing protein [Streptomyces sp. NPDC058683]|uniref:saccharopine dehydrogenase NADP-binding domain-containing protein n=1 Tax=Streptomyces sp. NPDC058683 TaxID=3346597 RepID=UPI0036555136